jgi:uncharacterized HAD superfamily protein
MRDPHVIAGRYLLGLEAAESALESVKTLVGKIPKSELLSYLEKTSGIKLAKSSLKEKVVAQVLTLNRDELTRLVNHYPSYFALYPNQVELILKCTKLERKRWAEEKKLTVVAYKDFDYGEFAIYDLLRTLTITEDTITQWREDYQQTIKENRQKGSVKAKLTKQKNLARKAIFKFQYEQAIKQWLTLAPQAIGTLKLAYWTVYVNRWAKTYQLRANNAKKHWEDYSDRSEFFYELKNQAIEILSVSPYTALGFYRPVFHSKEGIKDYYSLFYLELAIPGVEEIFSFHTPYTIGDDFFPNPEELPRIEHTEQEGLFRFGRPLTEDEMIVHTEKTVLDNFNEILTNFSDYNIEQQKLLKWQEVKQRAQQRREAEAAQNQRIMELKQLTVELSLEGVQQIIRQTVQENDGLSLKQLKTKIYNNLVPLAKIPFEFQVYPEYSSGFVKQAIQRQWNAEKILNLIFQYAPSYNPNEPKKLPKQGTVKISQPVLYKNFMITYSPKNKFIIYFFEGKSEKKKKKLQSNIPDLETAKYLIDTKFSRTL